MMAEVMRANGHRVSVVAPSMEQSATSMSTTTRRNLALEETSSGNWHLDAQPADTVLVASFSRSRSSAGRSLLPQSLVALAETLYHEPRAEKSDLGVTWLCPGFVNTDIVAATRRRGAGQVGAVKDELGGKWLDFSERALAGGIDPEIVGEQVYDAIVDNQFWLFTDALADELIRERHADIETRSTPGRRSHLVELMFAPGAES